jgi:RNA polymerase sigma factor (sigma-70 family)
MISTDPTTRTRFANDSDEDLIFYISLQGEDPTVAEEAWEEFFFRHWEYLIGVCGRFRLTLGDLGVEDLAQETLIRVYKKAHTYKPLETGAAHSRARVRAWLGQIANRLFLSSLRVSPPIDFADEPFAGVAEKVTPENTDNEPNQSSRLLLIREALRTLTEREREVLLASYAWYEPGVGCKRMPSDELAALTERFQTTAANIRQIRSRAFGKLEQYIADQHNK